jgi:hypothetical protein
MEAIGRLASGVAHDFNNLLTVITGFAQLALLDENPARAGLEQILSAAERAAGLTRQLLAFSRQQALVTKVFDVNALVRGMEKMLGRLIGEDVRVLTHLDPEPVTVKADPGQIEQVILNLAINSRDAMPDGGQLIITTARLQLSEMVAAAVGLEAATYHTLSVSDSGSGIPADILPLIFEPFYTTKPEGRGTGLGLSTSYGIVKQSGGALAVTSEPGLGTTMTIYLPAASSAMLPERAQNEIVETGSETVLLTEDDHAVLRLMEESLSARGFRVLTSDSAAQGLEILGKQPPGEVAILITDIVMPGMSGPLYAEKARQIQPGLKVLFASGYPRDVIQYHGLEEGTADFIQKPFAPGELVNKVRRLLDTGLKVRGVGSGSL